MWTIKLHKVANGYVIQSEGIQALNRTKVAKTLEEAAGYIDEYAAEHEIAERELRAQINEQQRQAQGAQTGAGQAARIPTAKH